MDIHLFLGRNKITYVLINLAIFKKLSIKLFLK